MTPKHDKTMTTGEQNARAIIAKLNDKYNKRGITFDYYMNGTYITIISASPSSHYQVNIDYSRFLFDESIKNIYKEIEEDLAKTNMIQGVEKDLIQSKIIIRTLQDQLKEYEEANLELKEKIELQDSLIQELKHIIETNGMNTRKRG